MKERKILLIGTLPTELGSKNYGGVARVVWSLAKTLNSNGFDVRVGGIGKYFKKYQKKEGIDIYGIGFSLTTFCKAFFLFLSRDIKFSAFSLRHLCKLFYSIYYLLYINKKIDFDVIHVHHVINQIPYAIRLIGLDAKILSTIHSYTSVINGEYAKERKNINIQLEQLDYVIHVSKHLRNIGIENGVKWKCEDKVIYNGINFINSNIHDEDEPKKICFVGSITKDKGIDKLLRSLSYIDVNDLELVVVGEGEYKKVIKNNINKYDYKISLTGQLSNVKAIETIRKSSILVNPSKSESFGLVYLEALSVGTPIIGYKPLMKEFVNYLDIENNSLRKWLIEYDYSTDSVETLADKILERLDVKSSTDYGTEKKKIVKKVKSKFDWKKIAFEYAEVYSETQINRIDCG